jgi:peptide/nickel transport system substrate-binding protein
MSARRKTITFRLRPGVTFSDGHPFTADDVVFTFEWMMNPAVAAPAAAAYYENVQTVKKVNDHEVAFVSGGRTSTAWSWPAG